MEMIQDNVTQIKKTDIAIIGMSCRFPDADNIEQFWENLLSGRESIRYFSDDELPPSKKNISKEINYIKAGSTISNVDNFDASFFGYSEKEAAIIDPQQRIILECAFEALEDAGYSLKNHKISIGVFAGGGLSTYFINNVHPNIDFHQDRTFLENINDLQLMIGNDKDYIPTRISYKLNLRGPSVNVQTACSTSLVAVHLACQSIINGECDMALAGAVNIIVPQNAGYLYEEDMVYSSDGHCRAFDEAADGTVFGSGVGIILLKSLEEAIVDGDDIYAIIKGSAINNDGGIKVGYTAPSVDGQAAVIAEAIAVSGLSAATISYIETHGTATKLGDPIEIVALSKAFQLTTDKLNYCAIGSVKTNIGHLSWAGGIAGLIKTALSLKNKSIPPSLNFKKANPRIDFLKTPFYVNSELQKWDPIYFPRRAGVSAFGIGGTNAHIILEEFLGSSKINQKQEKINLFSLSAYDINSLNELSNKYYNFLKKNNDINISDLCYTLHIGRQNYKYRLATIVTSINDLKEKLHEFINDKDLILNQTINNWECKCHPIANELSPDLKKLAFLFTGQGSQYSGMGKGLYDSSEYFRNQIDICDQYLRCNFALNIKDVLFNKESETLLNDIEYTQVAIFVIEYSLAKLWMSFGVIPDYVLGHSTGEYVAACIAGIFSLEDGLTLCFKRAKLMRELVSEKGQMVSIQASETETEQIIKYFGDKVSIAAINGPISTVISGDKIEIEKACKIFDKKDIKFKKLSIGRAGHSYLMKKILDPFKEILRKMDFHPPQISLISNISGKVASNDITTPEYWLAHTIQSVKFYASLQTLSNEGVNIFLEIGAKPDLIRMGMLCLSDDGHFWIPSLERNNEQAETNNDWRQIISGIAKFSLLGYPINWSAIYNSSQRKRLHLPTYAFQRKSYWVGEAPSKLNPQLDKKLESKWQDWLYQPQWIQRNINENNKENLQSETWLIFGCKDTFCDFISSKLIDSGDRFILIQKGADYKKESETVFTIDPNDQNNYNFLFRDVGSNSFQIVFTWGIREKFKIDSIGNYCHQFILLIQSILIHKESETKLILITKNTQFFDSDLAEPELLLSPLLGIIKVLQIEHPEINCKCIDIDSNYSIAINSIVSDLKYSFLDNIISYRNGERFIHKLIKKQDGINYSASKIEAEGSYLITGGMGGLGFLVAKWLIDKGAKSIVLIGRKKLSNEAIKKINVLNKNGKIAHYFSVDIGEISDVKKLFNIIDNLAYPLKGIIHAAGILDDGVIQQLNKRRIQNVLNPKIIGSWNLHTESVERNYKLNFFWLFSSSVSLIGNGGQANHAAANSFMDQLANHRTQKGHMTTSINWGAWSGVGELVDNELASSRLNQIGFETITETEGIKVFDYLLSKQKSQICIMPIVWTKFLSQGNLKNLSFFEDFKPNFSKTKTEDSILEQLHEQNSSTHQVILKDFIHRQALKTLGYKKVGDKPIIIDDLKPLTNYGIDSLSSIELRNKLQSSLKIKLPATLVFDYPSIDLISNKLLTVLSQNQANLSQDQKDKTKISSLNMSILPNELSTQQIRWLSLVQSGYGKRVVPIVFNCNLNKSAFYNSLLKVIERHELLRYYFPDNKKKIKEICEVLPLECNLFYDFSSFKRSDLAIKIAFEAKKCLEEFPELSLQPSWTIKCIKLTSKKFVVLLALQHLVFDGTSITNFTKELSDYYYNTISQNFSFIKELPVQYSEFVNWQNDYMKNSIIEDRTFFEGLYASLLETTVLEKHDGFTKTTAFESLRYTKFLRKKTWYKIINYASTRNVTPFSILFATYARLISEIIGSDDIVIAMIVNGRTDERFNNIIGPFTSPFPVRINTMHSSFPKLVSHCNRIISIINSKSYYPVTDLVSTNSVFNGFPLDTYFSDIGINFTNYNKEIVKKNEVKVLEILGPLTNPVFSKINTEELNRIPGLHLVINITEKENLNLNFWFHKHRFTKSQILTWAEKYTAILKYNLKM